MDNLVNLLKRKGTGPTMSKSLSHEDLLQIDQFLADSSQSLTTLSTLLTAIVTLAPSPVELEWIKRSRMNLTKIPYELRWLLSQTPESEFQRVILDCISGTTLSRVEARRWMDKLFSDTPDWEKAAFLEALRLRRESPEENQAAHEMCLERSHRISTSWPEIIDISNGYDGFNRTPYLAPFVASVIAALGVRVVLHGIDEVSPKRGITTHKLLAAAGKNAIRCPADICHDLERVGWTYIDQTIFSPDIASLKPLRMAMVKRPILATVEKLCLPVTGAWTGMVTGYTHPPYKSKTVALIANLPLESGVIIRGSEGSSQPPLDRRCPQIRMGNQQIIDDGFVRPEDFHLQTLTSLPWESMSVERNLQEGIDGLANPQGISTDLIRYHTMQLLASVSPPSLQGKNLETIVQNVIQSGKALERWALF